MKKQSGIALVAVFAWAGHGALFARQPLAGAETPPATSAGKQSIVGSSAGGGGLLSITDSVAGVVQSSIRPDSLFLRRYYDGRPTSGYTSGGSAIYPFIAYGSKNASTNGSVALLGGSINIYNSDNGSEGRSEFTPIAVAVVPIRGGRFVPGSNYYNDFNIQSPTGTGGQEGFLASGSFAVQKRSDGNVIDAGHAGSYGLAVTTVPRNIGFDEQDHSADRTYPLNALITLNGWSGVQRATSLGGQSEAASPAAMIGLRVGGNGGSVWSCATCRSYIPTGVSIEDYSVAAIAISQPATKHGFSGTAIAVSPGGGDVRIGDDLYVGSLSGGGGVQAKQITLEQESSTALPPLLTFRVGQRIGWQIGGRTDGGFVIRDSANGQSALAIDAGGNMTLGEGAGRSIMLPGTPMGRAAYALCTTESGQLIHQPEGCTLSSQRFRSILQNVGDQEALATVLKLRPVLFASKGDVPGTGADRREGQLGLIAEDVAAADPRAAIYEDDGKTVKAYGQESVVALLVSALKAQQHEIDELKQQLAKSQR